MRRRSASRGTIMNTAKNGFAAGSSTSHRVFAIEVCGYAVMSNHIHVVLRARPDLVMNWTDEKVSLHWRRLYPPRDPATGRPAEPSEHVVSTITSNPARVAELRDRLASLSWFMRCSSEPIARAANREVSARAGSGKVGSSRVE